MRIADLADFFEARPALHRRACSPALLSKRYHAAPSDESPAGMSSGQKITLEQVARQAGVSTSTVSRYLSGSHPVAPDKAAAIEGSIKRLNYRPNLVARGLATGRTMTVGVLTQEIVSTFFNAAMRGVEDGLGGHQYEAIYASGHWQPEHEAQRLNSLVGRGVDGVILIHPGLPDDVLERHAEGVPMVVVGRKVAARRVHSISFDHYQGARRALLHLLELGHRRIACIAGPAGRGDAEERLRAYHDTLAEAGVTPDARLVASGDYVEPGGLTAMNVLLDRGLPFTAVFAANDDSAYGAMHALHRRRLRIPDDISVVGFDDVQHSAYSLPPLTTVRQPLRELGREAANAIVALIDGRKPPLGAMAPLELIVRESTRALPVDAQAAAPAIALSSRRRGG
jgi:LacI family transcriptional regulator